MELHRHDPHTSTMVLEFVRERLSMADPPLGAATDADFGQLLDGLISEGGNDVATVLDVFTKGLLPTLVPCDSPRFLSFIAPAPSKASVLFDMVVSAACLNGISWIENSGVIAAENQVLRFIADLAGMPQDAGGCFVSGGSAGNLNALVVAREVATSQAGGDASGRLRVAVSDECHSSVTNALRFIGVAPLVVPTENYRLTEASLRRTLKEAPEGDRVIAVVGTAGSTNLGLVDDLAGIADVAQEHQLWFHVDAAYGGGALLADSVRRRFSGIERADSLVIDPHKWLFAPFDSGALIYRQPGVARSVHSQHASYLDPMHTGAPDEWNPTDFALHMSRRARGLPLWFSLAVHGVRAYRRAVETGILLAEHAANLVNSMPHLELICEPELSIVAFRRIGWNAVDYAAWSKRLHADGVAFVLPSVVDGETVARLAFMHPETTGELVRDVIMSTG